MSQLVFKFPFKTKYYEQDYYVSSNNFSSYRLIESWPNWPDKWVNIYGPKGCGKTHLTNILKKKIHVVKIFDAKTIDKIKISELDNLDCLIIDNFDNNIEEKLLYSILNQSKQYENYVLINSTFSINNVKVDLDDLRSRINSFLRIGIELPTDDLLKVIISKTLSEKQITVNPKISDFIISNVERSYEKMFKFLKDVDELSLSTGKAININLIKKVLDQ